jgi:hypothetical protein
MNIYCLNNSFYTVNVQQIILTGHVQGDVHHDDGTIDVTGQRSET